MGKDNRVTDALDEVPCSSCSVNIAIIRITNDATEDSLCCDCAHFLSFSILNKLRTILFERVNRHV